MKYFNKIILMLLLVSMSFACENFNLDLQEDPNALTPESASLNDLYNAVQLKVPEVFLGLQRAPGQAVRMYHAGAFQYAAWTTPNTFNALWTDVYADLFPDVDALVALAETNGFDIHAGTAKIMKAYVMMAMVDVFGDIPYTEAGNGVEIISPNVDSGSSVYAAALTLLQEATAQLTGATAAAPAYDNFYGGDATKWITLANTLRLRAAINIGTSEIATINSLIGGDIIDTAEEDFQFNAGNQRANPDSRHPFYGDPNRGHYETNDGDYLSNYYMWLMLTDKGSADPRMRYYFYRKIEDGDNQDATTYGCHHTTLPTESAGGKLNHWDEIDPGLRDSYCVVRGTGYSGRDHLNGQGIPPDGPIRTSYGLFPFGGDFDNDEFEDTRNQGTTGGGGEGIVPIMMSYQVDLLIAEAILSLGASGNAQDYMESGVRKSMAKTVSFERLVETKMTSTESVAIGGGEFEDQSVRQIYGTDQADIDAYVANLNTVFGTATTAQQLDMVIKENYIASWGNGLEAYNMYRRTGYPSNMQPALEPEPGQFPNSFFYPADFVTRNSNVEQKSLADVVFWADGSLNLY